MRDKADSDIPGTVMVRDVVQRQLVAHFRCCCCRLALLCCAALHLLSALCAKQLCMQGA